MVAEHRLKTIKWNYFIVIALIITLSIAFRIYYDIKHHDKMLHDRVTHLIENISTHFNNDIEQLNHNYGTIADFYSEYHPNIIKLVYKNRRQELHQKVLKDYNLFRTIDPHLYVMHFFDQNNVTVLRMHKPQSYGDDLSRVRPIVAHVNQEGKASHGFEVGKNGITYRITHPLFYNNFHVGVLEFGIRPSYFVDSLNRNFDIKAQILIKSDAMKFLSKKENYTHIKGYSLIYQDPFFHQILSRYDLDKRIDFVTLNDQKYLIINNLNLKSYDNRVIAKIVVAHNITAFIDENKKSLMELNSINITILLTALGVLYLVMRTYTQTILESFRKIEKLHLKTRTDALTKVYNKEFFNHCMEEFIAYNEVGSILFFDIDHFKKINDTHGHLVGDEVLKYLTYTIGKHLRDDDILARWGGEEFVILLNRISLEQSILKAEQLRQIIETTTFPHGISITISIGVNQVDTRQSIEEIIKQADALLYQAKNSGRNRVCY